LASSKVAASTGGYQAIVGIPLSGGNDHWNTLIPYDAASYLEYSNARGALAIPQQQLDATNLGPVSSQGGRSFSFHPALVNCASMWNKGQAAVVANVGPLVTPTTVAEYIAQSVPIPSCLMSHPDQQRQWAAVRSSGLPTDPGWGGRIADMIAANNPSAMFTAVGPSYDLWLAGNSVTQYSADANAPALLWTVSQPNNAMVRVNGRWPASATVAQNFEKMMVAADSNLLQTQLVAVNAQTLEAQQTLLASLPPANVFSTPIPSKNPLAAQLNTVARMIYARGALGVNSQVFMTDPNFGSFDFHSNLLSAQTDMLTQLDTALGAFYSWLSEMGVENNVVTFTMSEFGRQLSSNGSSGSDHGWGSHQIVLGGAVKGGIYGNVPHSALGVPEDAGSGILVPTSSIDQFGATLANWMGVSSSDSNAIFPNLSNFNSANLGFLG
jgi:uncharacterized protein (DUF1501 family)